MNKLIAQFVQKSARQAGYEIIPRWRLDDFQQALLLSKIFLDANIMCVLDVGANIGQFYSFIRNKVEYAGRIVSFEPISDLCAELNRKLSTDKDWSLLNTALGRDEGAMELNVMKSSVFSSFLQPSVQQTRQHAEYNRVERVESVSVKRLDSVLTDLKIDLNTTNTFIKIDTQGYDLEVLAGAPHALPLLKALQTEVSLIPIYDGMPTLVDTIEFMRNADFSLAGMFPVSSDDGHRVIEFDAIFVNNRFF